MTEAAVPSRSATAPAGGHATAYGVILAISFCHLLNDMMQSLLPAIYPSLKLSLGLNFSQIGLVTLAYQLTASILQPIIGLYADKKPTPLALPGGTLFSLAGLVVLSVAHSYGLLLAGASLLGMGSSVFHPESSRVARMAAGGRHGLAQSLFQVGGNAGSALGPLAAALVVVRFGQTSLAAFAMLALLSCAILWNVGVWYRHHGLSRLQAGAGKGAAEKSRGRARPGPDSRIVSPPENRSTSITNVVARSGYSPVPSEKLSNDGSASGSAISANAARRGSVVSGAPVSKRSQAAMSGEAVSRGSSHTGVS